MTIAELRELLKKFNPDTPVVIAGYQSGYNDIQIIKPVTLQLNIKGKSLHGVYTLANLNSRINCHQDNSSIQAIFIGGYNHLIPDINLDLTRL